MPSNILVYTIQNTQVIVSARLDTVCAVLDVYTSFINLL